MSDAIKLCNAAAVMLGAGVIQSLDDNTDLSRIFANLYERKKLALMSKYPWNFLSDVFYLSRDATAQPQGYKYSYVIPGAALAGAPHAVFSYQGQKLGSKAYRVRGNRVVTDYPELWAELVINRPESEWPEYFQELMIHTIAADAALAITDQQSIADRHEAKAFGTPGEDGWGGLMGAAMLLDSQSEGASAFDTGTFIAARRGAW